jgi:hypothetical protein
MRRRVGSGSGDRKYVLKLRIGDVEFSREFRSWEELAKHKDIVKKYGRWDPDKRMWVIDHYVSNAEKASEELSKVFGVGKDQVLEAIRRVNEKIIAELRGWKDKSQIIDDMIGYVGRELIAEVEARGAHVFVGIEIESVRYENYEIRKVFGVALTQPDPARDRYVVSAAGVFVIEEVGPGRLRYYVVKNERLFLESVYMFADDVKDLVKSGKIEFDPRLVEVFGEDNVRRALSALTERRKVKMLIGPLEPVKHVDGWILFKYVGDSVFPPEYPIISSVLGEDTIMLKSERILGAFRDKESNRYYLVYETSTPDFFRRISTRLPNNARPVDKIWYIDWKKMERYKRWCEEMDLEEHDCPAERAATVVCWRGSPYVERDFVEDDSFTSKRIFEDFLSKHGISWESLKEAPYEANTLGVEVDRLEVGALKLSIVDGVLQDKDGVIIDAGRMVVKLYRGKKEIYYVNGSFSPEVIGRAADVIRRIYGDTVYIWGSEEKMEEMRKAFENFGFKVKHPY